MIRLAITEDVNKIAQTYEELLTYEAEHGSTSNWRLGVYPTIGIPMTHVPKGEMYVLEEKGQICASMILNNFQPTEYEKIPWQYSATGDKVMVIHTLCIPPQMAGRGYGRQMVEYAIEKAKELGYQVIRIDTWAENKPAASLYTKCGFTYAGRTDVILQGLIPEEQIMLELKL